MRELKQRPACHRAEDLVTYLYGEASEAEGLDFSKHLQQCDACRSEFAMFNQVHDSIVTWRNEALGAAFNPRAVATEATVESRQFVHHEPRLSALAAIREFFTVSPLWLRGATAFAAFLLFVLGIAMIARLSQKPVQVAQGGSQERTFTAQEVQAEVDRAVQKTKEEIARQTAPSPIVPPHKTVAPNKEESTSDRVRVAVNRQTRPGRSHGLSRQEREQLAADLRLTNPAEEDELPLALPDQDEQRPNQ
jgi:anti-sigma factor RsiW